MMKKMNDTEKDTFGISGVPNNIHHTTIDWKNTHHRWSVAACLVKGVYVLERDRQQKRRGPKALSPPWWKFFNFQLYSQLVDDVDGSIFGAIYQLKTPVEGAPTFVIAFRGTNKGKSYKRDLKLGLKFIKNKLHQTSRFDNAMQIVQDMVAAFGGSDVWLAGHSLGAAIGMLVGRNMAKMGILLEAFLFNPPSISAPIEIIKSDKLKHLIRDVDSFSTAFLALAFKDHQQISQSEELFVALSAWVPGIFVNPADPLCSGYISYFEQRKRMEAMGIGSTERLATQNSWLGLTLTAIGREPADSEPLHLLPSANLTINRSPSPGFKGAHGLRQWWNPDLHFESEQYIYSKVSGQVTEEALQPI